MTQENLNNLYPSWKNGLYNDNSLIEVLKQNGLDSLQIIETLNHFKKKQLEERQTIGFVLTALGAFIGFLSCLFTMLDVIPEMRGFMLYGLTSIAIILAFVGLYYIFE